MKAFLISFGFTFLVATSISAQLTDECFKNYQVDTLVEKSHPELQFLDGTERFRTRINRAYERQKVEFAGHYVIAEWGCGAGCGVHAFINLINGEARFLLPGYGTGPGGVRFRPDSRLFVVSPDLPEDVIGQTEFFIINEDSLVQIQKNELPANCFE